MPNFIVKLRNKTELKQCIAQLNQRKQAHQVLPSINAILLSEETPEALNDMLAGYHVLRIDQDEEISLKMTPQPEQHTNDNLSWGKERMGVKFNRIPKRFPRPKVAIFGPGIGPHDCLPPIRGAINLSSEKGKNDRIGWGTCLAGLIGGTGQLSRHKRRFRGIYPDLGIYNVKVFDQEGRSTLSRIIRGLEWCTAQKVRIALLGFSIEDHHPSLYEALKAAHRSGLLLIAPAGDEGRPGLGYPARYQEVIAVGSTDRNDMISHFSQYGTDLQVVAPGEAIYSTGIRNRFQSWSGTAVSAAYVTGAIALLLSADPKLTFSQINELLKDTCQPLSSSYLLQGHGLISFEAMRRYLTDAQ